MSPPAHLTDRPSVKVPSMNTSSLVLLALCTGPILGIFIASLRPSHRRDRALQTILIRLKPVFRLLERSVNRPLIARLGAAGQHQFFLSYGFTQALGGALAIMQFKVFSYGVISSAQTDAFVLGAFVPMIAGNRLAGLLVQVFKEGLTLRQAIFKVRFLSIGMAAGMVASCVGGAYLLGVPVATITDGVFSGMLWAQFFGSVGCLYYGCCHGEVSHDHGAGFTYEHPVLKPNRVFGIDKVTVAPVPLYCAAFGLWILSFAIIGRVFFELPPGFLTLLVGCNFAMARFAEEAFRADTPSKAKGLMMNRVYSISFFLFSLATGLSGMARATTNWAPLTQVSSGEWFSWISNPWTFASPLLILIVVTALYSYHRGQIGEWRPSQKTRIAPAATPNLQSRLSRMTHSPYFFATVGAVAGTGTLLSFLPSDAIIVAAARARRDRWLSVWFWSTTISSTMAALLAASIRYLGVFAANGGASQWIAESSILDALSGPVSLGLMALGPIPLLPSLALSALSDHSMVSVFAAVWLGRSLKYLLWCYLASRTLVGATARRNTEDQELGVAYVA